MTTDISTHHFTELSDVPTIVPHDECEGMGVSVGLGPVQDRIWIEFRPCAKHIERLRELANHLERQQGILSAREVVRAEEA